MQRKRQLSHRFLWVVTLATLFPLGSQAQRGAQGPPPPRTLAIVDRTGAQTVLGKVPGNTNGPRVSPDGTRLAYGSGGLWVGPLMNPEAMKRIGDGQFPYWSADGTRLFFAPSAEVLSWRRVDVEDPGEQIWTPVRALEWWAVSQVIGRTTVSVPVLAWVAGGVLVSFLADLPGHLVAVPILGGLG